tara:strand:+ start:3326 stop:3964 length:639 start_codon:yes stop_codon:yes gene_type:complete
MPPRNVRDIIWDRSSSWAEKRADGFLTLEQETIRWIDEYISPEDVLWDIGACVGSYSLYAAVAVGCRVYAFEPEAENYALLNRNIRVNDLSNRITALCVGLGDIDCVTGLRLQGHEPGTAGHQLHGTEQGAVSFMVDSVSYLIGQPNHLKIDVDGQEARILRGAVDTLKGVETIALEGKGPEPIPPFHLLDTPEYDDGSNRVRNYFYVRNKR